MNFRLPRISISALLLSAALIIAAALPLRGQIAKSYVPALQARDGADLGLVLVNPSLAEAKVTLTARDYTGALGVVSPGRPAGWKCRPQHLK